MIIRLEQVGGHTIFGRAVIAAEAPPTCRITLRLSTAHAYMAPAHAYIEGWIDSIAA